MSFDGQAFFYEWGRQANNLYNFVLDGSRMAEINPLFHGVFNPWVRPMDMEFGPDGAMHAARQRGRRLPDWDRGRDRRAGRGDRQRRGPIRHRQARLTASRGGRASRRARRVRAGLREAANRWHALSDGSTLQLSWPPSS